MYTLWSVSYVYCASKLIEKLTRLLNYYIKAIGLKFLWFRGMIDHSKNSRDFSRVLPTSRVVYKP